MADGGGLFDCPPLTHEGEYTRLDELEAESMRLLRLALYWLEHIPGERSRLASMTPDELAAQDYNPAAVFHFVTEHPRPMNFLSFADWWYDKRCTCRHSASDGGDI